MNLLSLIDVFATGRLLVFLDLRSLFMIVVMVPENAASPYHIKIVTLLLTLR